MDRPQAVPAVNVKHFTVPGIHAVDFHPFAQGVNILLIAAFHCLFPQFFIIVSAHVVPSCVLVCFRIYIMLLYSSNVNSFFRKRLPPYGMEPLRSCYDPYMALGDGDPAVTHIMKECEALQVCPASE